MEILWIEKSIIYIRFILEINLDIYYWRVNVKSFVSRESVSVFICRKIVGGDLKKVKYKIILVHCDF